MSLQRRAGLVSVIVPVYNQPALIEACIESVLAQQYSAIELIVIDDGSQDRTQSVLKELAAQHANLRLFRQAHLGSGAARETGRLNARGEFIQYLNCFERISPYKLKAQINALRATPEVNIVCGLRSFFTERERDAWGQGTQVVLFPMLLESRCWRTGAPLYRRSLLDRIGPWLDSSIDETWEYEARIASLGEAVLLLDEGTELDWTSEVPVTQLRPLDPTKFLSERSRIQARIYQLAQSYAQAEYAPSEITPLDWANYSARLFQLGQHCALRGMTMEARAMLTLSVAANGRKTPKQRLFLKLVSWFGWRAAARLFQR